MGVSADQAKQQLLLGLERGFPSPHNVLRLPAPNAQVRNSAVLVLFGALDNVLASGSSHVSGVYTGPISTRELPQSSPLLGASAAAQIAPELDVLLLRRSNGLRNHAGQIAFPGGGVEPGDSGRAETALREAQEETGLDPEGVDVLGQLPDAHIPVSNYLVTPVIGWWRLPSEVAPDTQESVEVFRVPVAELIDPAARITSQLSFQGRTLRGPAFKLGPQFGGHIVWGFTAMMLAGIFDGVGWTQPWDEARTFEITR